MRATRAEEDVDHADVGGGAEAGGLVQQLGLRVRDPAPGEATRGCVLTPPE